MSSNSTSLRADALIIGDEDVPPDIVEVGVPFAVEVVK
jgi:hypothetical protein